MTHHTLCLRRGESRLVRVPGGSRWRAAHGRVHLAEPARWLGERVVQVETMLQRGQAHVVGAGGWVALRALDDSVMWWEAPVSNLARWLTLSRMIRLGRAPRAVA